MARRFDAVSLDVGGVLVVPDHGVLGAALDDAGIAHDRDRFGVGHYLAMAAMDRATSDAEDFTDYLQGFLAAVGVSTVDESRGATTCWLECCGRPSGASPYRVRAPGCARCRRGRAPGRDVEQRRHGR